MLIFTLAEDTFLHIYVYVHGLMLCCFRWLTYIGADLLLLKTYQRGQKKFTMGR